MLFGVVWSSQGNGNFLDSGSTIFIIGLRKPKTQGEEEEEMQEA